MINKTKKITINGAGLIGPYLGILLRRRGFDVEIIETKPYSKRKTWKVNT